MQDGFALEVRVTPADIDKAFEVMQDIIFVYDSLHWLNQSFSKTIDRTICHCHFLRVNRS